MKTSSKNNPLVSIIVPVYNQSPYILSCLNSLTNQSYQNIEIIIVNDASTDDSLTKIQLYIKSHPNIHLYAHKTNRGPSAARNTGIEKAHGDFLCFVDGDDLLHPDFISTLIIPLLSTKDTYISCCRYQRFSETTPKTTSPFSLHPVLISSKDYLIKTLYQSDQTLYSVSACNKLYAKKVFQTLRFPEGTLYEDFATIDQTLELTQYITILDEILYYYRITKNSITTSKFNETKLIIMNHCEALLARHKNNQTLEKAIKSIKYSKYFELLTTIHASKYHNPDIETKLWNYIKKTRSFILKNPTTRHTEKFSAILSYFGKDFSTSINILRKKLRGY